MVSLPVWHPTPPATCAPALLRHQGDVESNSRPWLHSAHNAAYDSRSIESNQHNVSVEPIRLLSLEPFVNTFTITEATQLPVQ